MNIGSITSDSHQAGTGRRSATTSSPAWTIPTGLAEMSSVPGPAANAASAVIARCGSHRNGTGPVMGGIGCGADVNRSFRTTLSAPRTVPPPTLSM